MGIPPSWVATAAFVFGIGTSIASIAILAVGREEARQAGIGDRADLMLLAGLVSLLPALLALIVEWVVPTALPWYAALLWVGFFPVAVGYGMVRRQLFEFRLGRQVERRLWRRLPRDHRRLRLHHHLRRQRGRAVRRRRAQRPGRPALPRDPRLQPACVSACRVVDNFFDRDRSQYRRAVREISEAMVSMLSMNEIGDRILAALTDTMGVSRAMVLLFDDGDRVPPGVGVAG